MTWQARTVLVLLVAFLALEFHIARAVPRLRAWFWRHRRSWRVAPPSPYGAFTPLEWQEYRRKNKAAL